MLTHFDLVIHRATVALVIILPLLAGCSDKAVAPDVSLETGLDQWAAGDYDTAVITFKNLVRDNPDFAEGRYRLGLLHLDMGNAEAAEKEFNAYLKLDAPRTAALLGARIRAKLAMRDYDGVLDITDDGDLTIPDGSAAEQADVHALIGHAYYWRRDRNSAAEQYGKAAEFNADGAEFVLGQALLSGYEADITVVRDNLKNLTETHPEFASGFSYLAEIYSAEQNYEAAELAYGKAIDLRYDDRKDHLDRALTRIYLKRFDDAEQDIAVLQSKAAKHPGGILARGLLAFHRQELDPALDFFRESYAQTPDRFSVVYYLGVVHFLRAEYEQAELYLTKAHQSSVGNPQIAKMLAAMQLQARDAIGAEKLLLPLLSSASDDVQILEMLATASALKGNSDVSVDYLKRVIESTDEGYAHLNLGMAQLLTGERVAAVESLETAVKLSKEMGMAEQILIRDHLQNREFDKAIALARRLQADHPDSHLPLSYLGLASMLAGDIDVARVAYRDALKIKPGALDVINNLAMLELGEGNTATAIQLWEDALKKNPGNTGLTHQLVALYTRNGDIEKAKSLLENAITADGNADQSRIFLARYYLSEKDPGNLQRMLEPLVSRRPNDPRVIELIGRLQMLNGNFSSAKKTYERLALATPNAPSAHVNLAYAMLSLGELDHVPAVLQQALDVAPTHVPAKVAMTRTTTILGDTETATKLLDELKTAVPDHPEIIALEAWMLHVQNKPKEAVPLFERALAAAPDSELLIDLASARWQASDFEGAIQAHVDWLADNSKDAMVMTNLGAYYQTLNRRDDAIRTYEDVLKINPKYVPALNNLAWMLRKTDLVQARQYAGAAYEQAPTSPEIADTYGATLLMKGEHEQALDILERAARQSPDNMQIQYHHVKAMFLNGNRVEAKRRLTEILASGYVFEELEEAKSLMERL